MASPQPPTPVLKCEIILAPTPYTPSPHHTTIFLSGSISPLPNWQSHLTTQLSSTAHSITILNPYRADWTSAWKEDLDHAPFVEQVNWELSGLENAQIIVVFFQKSAQAPISLMELGLHVRNKGKKVVVACERGYWKRGNVLVVCRRYGIEVLETLEELVEGVKRTLDEAVDTV